VKTDRIGGEQSHARHRHFGLVDERDRFALVALAMAGNTADALYDLPDAGEDLRVCAASARELLVGLAAERLNIDADRLEASHAGSTLRATRASRRRESASAEVALTLPSRWRYVGHAAVRATASALVTGAHRFPSDLARPEMLYARVLRAPAYGWPPHRSRS
jgi:hypothetical protein